MKTSTLSCDNMLDFDDLPATDIENDHNPRNFTDIEEGSYHDLEITDPESTPGMNSHLHSSIWNREENVFITDHHAKSLAPWLIAENEWYGDSTLLVHIDLHADREEYKADENMMKTAFDRGDAIRFADLGHISEVMNIAEEFRLSDSIYSWGTARDKDSAVNSLQDLDPAVDSYDRVILDVDLDVFEGIERYPPSGNWSIEDYYSAISELERESDLATYATSPGFIDQYEAVDHLAEIRSY